MSSTLKILTFFIENKDKSFSINYISKKLKLNYRIAFEEIKKLEDKKLISINKLGNSNQCRFNYSFNEMILKAELDRRDELLKNTDIRLIYERIKEIKDPFFTLLIFGSYAKKKQAKNSDIDICLMTDNEEINKKIKKTLNLIPSDIHLLDFTAEEFMEMLETRKNNVGKEIVNDNVILFGIENFYGLVEHD